MILLLSKPEKEDTDMPVVTTNGINIEYETFGKTSSTPLLLIMGLGVQMIFWPDGFCRSLAEKDFYVIRFDNRDVGLSSKFEEAGIPDVLTGMTAALRGEKVEAPYTLEDMADDAAGLLDSLKIKKAHICGASMGGMIAQTLAAKYPQKTLSLISIMSNTGDHEQKQPEPEVLALLVTPAPEERGAYIRHSVEVQKKIGGKGIPCDEEWAGEIAGKSFDRCFYPQGITRQMMAIMAGGNRKPFLAGIKAPTLVIHGSDDPLVPVENGKDTADSIPGAEILIVKGMGHDLPAGTWPQIIDGITKHTENI